MPSPHQAQLARYQHNLQGEVDSAALYRALADCEQRPEQIGRASCRERV